MEEQCLKAENLAVDEPEAVSEEQLFLKEPIKVEYPLDMCELKKDPNSASFDEAGLTDQSFPKHWSPIQLERLQKWEKQQSCNEETQGIEVGSPPDPFQFVDCSQPSEEENLIKIEHFSEEEQQFFDESVKVDDPVDSFEWNEDRISGPAPKDKQGCVLVPHQSISMGNEEYAFRSSTCKDLQQGRLTSPSGTPIDVSELSEGGVPSSQFTPTYLVRHGGDSSDSESRRDLEPVRRKPFKCDHCDKTFNKKGNLSAHIRVHTGEKRFKCDHCEKAFFEKCKLLIHERVHTGVKPFKCDLCEKEFSQKDRLLIHKRLHTGETPFKCDHCEKTFSRKYNLVCHERVHTAENPFKCDQCEEGFSGKRELKMHKRIHTGGKPFKCDLCEKSFPKKHLLEYHRLLHKGEKPFKCDLCEKSFSRNYLLVRHEQVHTAENPFKCDQCNKGFSGKRELKKHKRIHTGEKTFQCDLCEKLFSRKIDLLNHKLLHTGEEKPFKCDHCEKSYFQKSNLVAHMRVVNANLAVSGATAANAN